MPGPYIFRDGPAYVASSVADLYVPSANTVAYVKHIHLANDDSSAVTVSLYLGGSGGTAAGTQILGGVSIAANDVLDVYFPQGMRQIESEYISGVASAANAITCIITGELHADGS